MEVGTGEGMGLGRHVGGGVGDIVGRSVEPAVTAMVSRAKSPSGLSNDSKVNLSTCSELPDAMGGLAASHASPKGLKKVVDEN